MQGLILDVGQGFIGEAFKQQGFRLVAGKSARHQVKKLFAIKPAARGSVTAFYVIGEDFEFRLVVGLDVGRRLGLKGLVSLDFIVNAGVAHLIEVNPRPGAGLDVFDDASGTLFKAHVAAASGADPTPLLAASWRPEPRAAAYFYADRAALKVPEISWPEWTSGDRP